MYTKKYPKHIKENWKQKNPEVKQIIKNAKNIIKKYKEKRVFRKWRDIKIFYIN